MIWTDNPVADAAAYDAECERWLQRRPVCDECHEHIQDDHYYDIRGMIICPDCMNDHKEYIDDEDY